MNCPKEAEWQRGKCFAASAQGQENAYNAAPTAPIEVNAACCRCPSARRLKKDDSGCYYTTAWFRRRVDVASSCCEGRHYESRMARKADNPNDEARDLYHKVVGKGFRDAPPPPPPAQADYGTSRRLMSVGQSCGGTGTCMDVSDCQGTTKSGLCPGAANIKCCFAAGSAGSAPAPSAPTDTRGLCPDFYKIWEAYPPDSVPSSELRAQIGFGDWVSNTCTVRTTIALNSIGLSPGDIGQTKWRAKGKRYLIRVLEGEQFLLATFGKPIAVGNSGSETGGEDEQGNAVNGAPASIRGKAGIIHWSDCNFSDATGHLDVWDGQNIRGHGYFGRCKKVQVTNVCNRVRNPDYTAFKAFLQRTGAA